MPPASHEIHTRRRSRNIGLGVVLGALVLLIYAVTIVKLQQGSMMEAFDHTLRPSLLPVEEQ